jgi:hypothetical protein
MYRRKNREVHAFKWEEDESIIEDINKALAPINKKGDFGKFETSIATNPRDNSKVLCLTHKMGYESSTSYVYRGDYAVLDLNEDIMPFTALSEEYFKENYDLI